MAEKVRYNKDTGKWESICSSGGSDSSIKKSSGKDSPSAGNDGNKDSSSSKAKEKCNEIDYYNLQGTLNYIATPSTIKIKAGDTIKINGLGKYLSGKYYVVSVKRTIDSGGYSHSAEVVRMNFGSSATSSTITSAKKETKKKEPVKPKTEKRPYTVIACIALPQSFMEMGLSTHLYIMRTRIRLKTHLWYMLVKFL